MKEFQLFQTVLRVIGVAPEPVLRLGILRNTRFRRAVLEMFW